MRRLSCALHRWIGTYRDGKGTYLEDEALLVAMATIVNSVDTTQQGALKGKMEGHEVALMRRGHGFPW